MDLMSSTLSVALLFLLSHCNKWFLEQGRANQYPQPGALEARDRHDGLC